MLLSFRMSNPLCQKRPPLALILRVLPLDFRGLPTQPLSVPSLVAASRLIWRWLHLRTGYFRASIPHLPFTAQAVHFNPAGRRPRRASLVSLILEAAIVEVYSLVTHAPSMISTIAVS